MKKNKKTPKAPVIILLPLAGAHRRYATRVHLVVAPEPGQAVWVHDAEDFALCILPADVVLVPAVRQELVDVVPQQPAV